jgi:hypothetical protein
MTDACNELNLQGRSRGGVVDLMAFDGWRWPRRLPHSSYDEILRTTNQRCAILPPMKLLRIFLVLLLCAVLPLTGLAASGMTGDCPMQQSGAMEMYGAMPNCNSMKSSHDGKAKGTFCKMTAQCQIGSQSIPATSLQITRPASFSSPVVFSYTQVLPMREPSGLWRPPRAV